MLSMLVFPSGNVLRRLARSLASLSAGGHTNEVLEKKRNC